MKSKEKTLSNNLHMLLGVKKNILYYWYLLAITGFSWALMPIGLMGIDRANSLGEILYNSLLIFLAPFGTTLFIFIFYHQRKTKKFIHWIESEIHNLDNGALNPEGYVVTWDTPLIQYKIAFSIIFATTLIVSSPYLCKYQNSSFSKVIFTLSSIIFGWWFLGFDGINNTLDSITHNLSSDSCFTLRELIEEHDRELG